VEYDPNKSTFLSVDPLAEKYPNMGGYVYCANNPIKFIDIEGKDIYLFIYASKDTESGAGHVAMAIGQNPDNLTYYSHYRKQDGGGQKVNKVGLKAISSDYEKKNFKHGQTAAPTLVIRIKTSEDIDKKMMETSDENITSTWTLMSNNCADVAKDALNVAEVSEGVAFGVSTPNELVEDLFENNKELVGNKTISVIKGDLKEYLKNEPNSVNQVIFGKDEEL